MKLYFLLIKIGGKMLTNYWCVSYDPYRLENLFSKKLKSSKRQL
ncbi:hypothetical protein CCAND95_430037 [Capnocytophaga canis]|nr:hypothetical protein CCAND95_430037 [Capnocytophaga canis]